MLFAFFSSIHSALHIDNQGRLVGIANINHAECGDKDRMLCNRRPHLIIFALIPETLEVDGRYPFTQLITWVFVLQLNFLFVFCLLI